MSSIGATAARTSVTTAIITVVSAHGTVAVVVNTEVLCRRRRRFLSFGRARSTDSKTDVPKFR